MSIVYFDRNVFADICDLRRGLIESDVAKIKQAVESKAIVIPASITLFEETLGVLHESCEKYDQHIKVVLNLVDKERMVKPPNQLLKDDCYSYAQKTPYQRTTETPAALRGIFDLVKNRDELITLVEETTRRYKETALSMTEALLAARVAGEERDVGTPEDFNELWEGLSVTMVGGLLSQVPRPIRRLCKKHDLKNMLNIKSIRLYTIYYAWLVQSGWFGLQGSPRKMKEGDVGDFFHAVQSSVADIFVTQESKDKKNKGSLVVKHISTSAKLLKCKS
jgi:hypothetical protein